MNLPRPLALRAATAATAVALVVTVVPAAAQLTPPAQPGVTSGPRAVADPDITLDRAPGSVVRAAAVPLGPTRLVRALGSGRPTGYRSRPLTSESFRMVALTWRGRAGQMRVRTRHSGRWSAWRVLEPLADVPDARSGEGNGTRGTELVWVGPAEAVQVETPAVRPRELRLQLIDPGVLASDRSATPVASQPAPPRSAPPSSAAPGTSRREAARRTSARGTTRPLIGYGPLRPRMFSRAQWGANEGWRNDPPSYGPRLQQVHVHHTASSSTYAPADVPAQIRGFYRYHTATLGWSDIGYNFLVDRFGRIWVGRAGGPTRLVTGAHTLGFNTTSTGIAVLGNYQSVRPGPRVLQSVARIAAWKLNPWRQSRPARWTWVYSQGSDDYRAGRWVALPVVDGHRDTNDTACPGYFLYARLPWIRTRAQALTNAW